MSETNQPLSENEDVGKYVRLGSENQKRHEDLEFDERKAYYELRKKWFPRFACFIVGLVVVNYFFVFCNGMKWLDISPWVLQSLITESMIGILGLAGVMAMYLYPPGKGFFKSRYKLD